MFNACNHFMKNVEGIPTHDQHCSVLLFMSSS